MVVIVVVVISADVSTSVYLLESAPSAVLVLSADDRLGVFGILLVLLVISIIRIVGRSPTTTEISSSSLL